jgi:O-antigen/teichoic acid export membrane protein
MIGRLRKGFTNGGLAKSGTQTVATMAMFLVLSLISGVMTARLLGSSGRGEIAAIVTIGQTIGWAVSIGCFQAIVFHNSRNPDDSRANIGTWIAIAVPMGVIGVIAGELIVGPLFREQSAQTVHLARLWILLIPLMPISEALSGALVASRDFAAANALRLMQQVITVAVYLLLWIADAFSVETVMLTQLIVITSYLGLLLLRTHRRIGIHWPRRRLARSGLSYGFRAQASNIGGQLNARLDLFIMPAFLVASQIGLYAVAVSVSALIVSLAGSLTMIVQPVAASGGSRSSAQVAKMFHATMLMGIMLAIPVALLAPWLLELVYSSQFSGAAGALRLLAPGAVLLAMSNIVVSGLYGQNRPATAGATQLPGVVITVVGLLLFLRSGGIEAAALISTITYATSLVIASAVYLRQSEIDWRQLYDARETAAAIVEQVSIRLGHGAVPKPVSKT